MKLKSSADFTEKLVETANRHHWLKLPILLLLLCAGAVALSDWLRASGRRPGASLRAAALALAACVAFTLFPAAAFADGTDNPPNEVPPDSIIITAFELLDPETAEQTLAASAEAMPALPESLSAQTAEGPITIDNVSWSEEPAFVPESEGDYTFTAALPEGYLPAEGVALPVIRVIITAANLPPANDLIQPLDLNLPESEANWHLTSGNTDGSGTLQEAFVACNGDTVGGEIILQKNVKPNYVLKIDHGKTITLKSAEGQQYMIQRPGANYSSSMIVCGDNSSHSATADAVLRLENIIIDGGAVWADGKTPAEGAENTGLKQKLAAISVGDSLILGEGAVVQNNDASNSPGAGGGIHDKTGAKIELLGTAEISGNAASEYAGGGILYESPYYALSPRAGLILLSGSAAIKNNAAKTAGGGIYAFCGDDVNNPTLQISMTESAAISGNTASWGGGICCENDVEITLNGNSEISRNTASQYGGGGIYSYNNVKILMSGSSSINQNAARLDNPDEWGGEGGGVRLDSGCELTLSESAGINGNQAACLGGGIYANYADITIKDDSKVSDNTADNGNGGGIYFDGDTDFKITGNAAVTENKATGSSGGDGGGIYLYGSLTVDGSAQISENTASGLGGGIYSFGVSGETLTIGGQSKIIGNQAAGKGGGLYSSTNLLLKDSVSLQGNISGSDGGGVYLTEKSTLQDSVTITGNRAESEGGGVYYYHFDPMSSERLTLVGNIKISNNTKNGAANNLYIPSLIALSGTMGPNANVGFHLPADTAAVGREFSTGSSLTESDAKAFFYDSGGFGVEPKADGTGLLLNDKPPAPKPTPSPSYSGGNVSSEFYVTVIAGPNGKANPPEGFYARDEKHTFTVIPDEGYVIDTVTLDDGSLLSHTDTQFILLVDEPYEVHVTFKRAAAALAPTPSKNPQTGGTEPGAPWLLLLLGMGGLVLARRLRESEA